MTKQSVRICVLGVEGLVVNFVPDTALAPAFLLLPTSCYCQRTQLVQNSSVAVVLQSYKDSQSVISKNTVAMGSVERSSQANGMMLFSRVGT